MSTGRQFFGKHGDSVPAVSADELTEALSRVDIGVPAHGRTTEHRERYCVVKLLQYRLRYGALKFPLCLTKNRPDHKSPDFILSWPNSTIGIEHTDAGAQLYRHAIAKAEQDDRVVALELPAYSQSIVDYGPAEIEKGFVLAGESLHGDGWTNYEAEDQWADLIFEAFDKKRQKLQSGQYDACHSYHLLIYDNTPNVVARLNYKWAFAALRKKIGATPAFHQIAILDDTQLFDDVLG